MTVAASAAEVFERFEPVVVDVPPGWTMNWLGVKTRAEIQSNSGAASGPIRIAFDRPSLSEDFFEWLDVLESVVESSGTYTIVELGAGWGRWLVNAAAAVRRYDPQRRFLLVGVEGEPTHFEWLRRHLADNGIDPGEHVLVRAAVAARDGRVRFEQGDAAAWYGQAIPPDDPQAKLAGPVSRLLRWGRNTAANRAVRGPAARKVRRVRAVSLATVLRTLDRVDLMDVDIQGAEAAVFATAAEELTAKVARVHVGTHGAENEARVRSLFGALGWECRFDYPGGREVETPWGPVTFEDGAQSWLNPALRASA